FLGGAFWLRGKAHEAAAQQEVGPEEQAVEGKLQGSQHGGLPVFGEDLVDLRVEHRLQGAHLPAGAEEQDSAEAREGEEEDEEVDGAEAGQQKGETDAGEGSKGACSRRLGGFLE